MARLADASSRTSIGRLAFFFRVGIGSGVAGSELARFVPRTFGDLLVRVRFWRSHRDCDALQQVLYALGLEGFLVRGCESTCVEALSDLSQGGHVRCPDFLYDRD